MPPKIHTRCLQIATFAGLLLFGSGLALRADHVPAPASKPNAFAVYQLDASRKRYADILELAELLEAYETATGEVPILNQMTEDHRDYGIWQVAVLGQDRAVNDVFEHGSPFEFSLFKYRAGSLITVLEAGLGRSIDLPIDPQKVATTFNPVYWVFLRPPYKGHPARFVVIGSFAQPVSHSTRVAEGVHLVGISNHPDLPHVVPLIGLQDLAPDVLRHIREDGREADAIFGRFVATRTD
jgi:hypothetical protein